MGFIKYQDHQTNEHRWVRATVVINEREYYQDHEVYPEAIEYLGLKEAKERTRMLARLKLLGYLGREVFQ